MSGAVLRATLVSLLLLNQARCEEGRLGPWFEWEPPPLVRFAASRGARVRCVPRGEPPPALSWLHADGAPLAEAPGIRRIYSNGTLEVLPSPSYQHAAVTLQCRAVNAHGVALSREFTLQPVPEEPWEPVVTGGAAAAGGVAALGCRAGLGADLLPPVLWYRADTLVNLDRPTPESRYIAAGDTLLIRDVSPSDAGPYSCVVRHALSNLSKRSRALLLTVTEGTTSAAPRLVSAAGELSVPAGEHFCMPCVSSEHPPPQYTWYREWEGRLQAVEPSGELWLWAGGAALCARGAASPLAGAWLCKAYNVFGDATLQLKLNVRDVLTVTVAPTLVRARPGGTVRFQCSASDARAALAWVHEGAPAAAGPLLEVRDVTRAHRGVYQCFARRHQDSAQAAAELRLGESAPELVYTFIEQALRAGGSVSLRCAASGAPPPRLAWMLDGQPLDHYRTQHRYFISEETSVNGDVVSILNISSVSTADGGRYTCRAYNDFGSASHSARLNIYGPPSIRALGPVRVVAGANATVYCPYAGYPISSVSWRRRGAGAALGAAGRVRARGAELRLAPAVPADAGHYACEVAPPHGAPAARDIEIQVRNPPKISPFMFSSELIEGSSVQVLCGVSSGDKPMYFSWLKDGEPLPSGLQIEEKSLNEFSLLMFSDLTARHSGEYTCRVSNHAATVNYTATLSVKVASTWVTEPLDAAVLLGAPLLLECAAKGYPTPTVTWYRRIGESSALGPESEQWETLGGAWGGAEGAGAVVVKNGSLGAAAAARGHQGQYRCTADNGVGPPLVKHVNVTVHEPAHFEGSGGNVSSVRGRSATLSCHARGDAPLAVHWTHRGVRLDLNSYRYTVSEVRAGAAGGLRSTLTLRAAERADAGQYRCLAHNHYGRSELTIYLYVEEPPATPHSLQLGGVGSRWVRVRWRSTSALPHAAPAPLLHAAPATLPYAVPAPLPHAASAPLPNTALYYTALCTALHSPPAADPTHLTLNLTLDAETTHRLDDGMQTLSARLESLRPASAYSLRLAAGNHVGQSPYSEPLMFTTLEEAPAAPPLNIRVRPASSGELHVSWSTPPQESWNGELLGYVVTWHELGRVETEGEEEGEEPRAGHLTVRGWNTKEVTVAGLRANTRYAVAVQAYNVAGAGLASPLVYSTTSDGVPEVAPSSVTCEGVTARSLRVRWFSPPAPHTLRGYDVQYVPLEFSPSWSDAAESQTTVAGVSGEVTLQGLAADTNYSVWVRARGDAGRGPPSRPAYCATAEDAPGAAPAVRALAAGADAVRVTWLPPRGRITHYTLYTRDLAKAGGGGEWSQRVEAGEAGEVWREVRGLRPAVYEVWVRAATAAGTGPPSRPVTVAPAHAVSARISSFGREISVARGTRVRLRCAAVGAPPIRWRWAPLPPAHTVTDTGDLIIHKVEESSGGNYTCTVRNAGGSEAAQYRVVVRLPPAAPAAPRLARADPHALHLAWERGASGRAPVLSYTVQWTREGGEGGAAGAARVPGGDAALSVRRLACGAQYRITLQAHNAVGDSPLSRPLLARTKGDKAVAAPGKEFVWANSSALRLNLVSWEARCGVSAWRVAVRGAGAWRSLAARGGAAAARGLAPGAWYLVRVRARSPAGDTAALYRAPTRALSGERIGEPVEVSEEMTEAEEGSAGGEAGGGAGWGGGVAPALLGGGLAALLAGLAGTVAARRGCLRGGDAPHERPRGGDAAPHPQLYSTEPTKRNGKALTPPLDGDLEISPYATFSMSEVPGGARAAAGGGCALHLHTFGRGEPLDLAAPPPRPNLLSHAAEYGRSRDSDSESSGSPCAACAADLYRLPASHLSDTLPAVESSAEDTSYSAGGGGRGSRPPTSSRSERSERGERGVRHVARGRRRRDHTRHSSGPTVRYPSAAEAAAAAAAALRQSAGTLCK